MRHASLGKFAFVFAIPLLSCGLGMAQDSSTTDVDKMFLHKSAEGSLAEIQLGKLALSKSHNHDIRQLAQKMIHDHTKIMQNMRPLGAKMGLHPATALTAEDQLEERRLRDLSGNEFDRQYVSAMVADHQKDLAAFREEAGSTSNPFLKKTVEEAGQVLQQHAEIIDQLARNNGISAPGR